MPSHPEDWEPLNGHGRDLLRRVFVGDTLHKMAGMHTEQRIKRQNRGNNVPLHHHSIFGSRDQVGSGFAVASGEAQGSMSYPPARTMCLGFHQLPGEGSNSTFIDRNFPPAEAGSSSSFGIQSYNASLLRSPVSERGTLNYPGSHYLGNSRRANRSACKRKIDDAIRYAGSSMFRPILEQRGTNFSWFTEEASTSRGELATPPLSSDRASMERIPVLDDLSYSRDNILLSELSRARPLQHLHVASNRHDGEHSYRSHQVPFLGRGGGSPDAMMCNAWMSREALARENMMSSARSPHEITAVNGGNCSSAVVPWRGNAGESSMNPSCVHRDFNYGIRRGSQARNFPNGALSWMGLPDTMQSTFDPSSRGSPGFPCRDSTSRRSNRALEYTGHALSLHPPALPPISHNGFNGQGALLPYRHAATGNMRAAPGSLYSLYGLLNRAALMPPFQGSAGNVGASPLCNFYGMPFRELETRAAHQGMSGQRLPYHESLDHAVAYNGFNIQDHHIGLQPDVDNMSYEELLALEERIGNVNTGLSEENICECLKTSKHSSRDVTMSVSQESETKCSICQEEYMEGDELGQLKCSHSYHTGCIKQWLVLKNQCPICKAAALSL